MVKKTDARDKILFKHYTYRGGAEYVDIITAMEEYANYKIKPLLKRIEKLKQNGKIN